MAAIRIIDDHLELASIGTNTHAQIDTHIAAANNYVKRDGSLPLTADWDIGDTRKIKADEIRARDAAGLKLYDDGGHGVFVKDGGSLEIEATTSDDTGVIYKGADWFIHNFQHPSGGGAVPVGLNTFVGINAGNFTMGSTATDIKHASYNTAIGYEAFHFNTIGQQNVAIGWKALHSNTEGSYNFGLGHKALTANTEGNFNVAVGTNTLISNTNGNYNVAVGTNALKYTTGSSNVGIGSDALHSNIGGLRNNAIGHSALHSNTSGNYNCAIGLYALYSNTTGKSNIATGYNAGRYISGGAIANTTCDYSVFFGEATKPLADNDQNEIVIGYNATGVGSNSVVLGNDSITKTILKGDIGLGTTSPTAKLDVNSDIFRLRTAKTPASAGAAGNTGDRAWDADYFYICVATNTWERTAHATWV